MLNVVVRSQRLVFCIWNESDAEAFVGLCHRQGLRDFSSPAYHQMTVEKARAFIARESGRYAVSRTGRFAVYLADSGELIGISGIFEMDAPRSDCFEINYRFCSDYWGKGIGAEAARTMVRYGFEQLGLKKVYAVLRSDNLRSLGVVKKIRMMLEQHTEWQGYPAQLWSAQSGDWPQTF